MDSKQISASLFDYGKLHFIILLWGFTAILGKLIEMPSVEMVFIRTLLSALGMAVLLFWKKENLKVPLRPMLLMLLMGGVIALHWITFFLSARISNVSVCLAGLATTTFWTAFIDPLANRRSIKWYEVVLGVVVIVGIYIIFRFQFNHFIGLLVGISSAVCSATFSVANGKFTHNHNHQVITFYEMLGALASLFLFLPFYSLWLTDGKGLQLGFSIDDLMYLLILSQICTVYAYAECVELLKRIPVFAANLSINLEPVYGILLAFAFFQEHKEMTGGFYVGTLVILASVLIYPLLKKWDNERKTKLTP